MLLGTKMNIQNSFAKGLLGAIGVACVALLPQSIAAQTIKIKWEQLPGRSLDVGVGHRGHVWSIGPNRQA